MPRPARFTLDEIREQYPDAPDWDENERNQED